jgi:hypothetical protein
MERREDEALMAMLENDKILYFEDLKTGADNFF